MIIAFCKQSLRTIGLQYLQSVLEVELSDKSDKIVRQCFPQTGLIENIQAAMEQALHNVCNQRLNQPSALRVQLLQSCKRENVELQ